MELAHDLRRCNIDRVLISERPPLYTENKAEVFNVAWKITEGELNSRVLFEVVKLESLKIAYKHVARKLGVL